MPDWTQQLRPRLARLHLNPAREAEIVEELSLHLDQRYEELLTGGASADDARRLAIEELLEPAALANRMRTLRQANVSPPVVPGSPRRFLPGDLWQDLRYAVRMLLTQRTFAAVAVLTLALGIGANSAIFALVDATLLRPLPFPEPDRLVMLWERTGTLLRGPVSPANLHDWSQRSRTFEAMAAFVPNVGGMVMSNPDGTAETVPRQWLSAGVLDVLGIQPIVGRTFRQDDVRQRASVVVLSEAFWRTHFNADPTVVGRSIRLDGDPNTIVGVLPKEADLLGRTSLWALAWNRFPEQPPAAARTFYNNHAIGRLKPGVTLEAARDDLASVAESLAREFPGTNAGRGVTVEPLDAAVIGSDLRRTSIMFLGVVGFVLLICCANVANLMLTRAMGRRRELAMRSALGADRGRLVRQLMTESLVVSVVGGASGVAVGAAILHVAPALIPPDLLPAAVTLAFDIRVLAFCAATSLAVGLLFGLAPAWQATQVSAAHFTASDSRTTTARGGTMRALLVAGQVATAVVLLVGAGLLLRTLVEVESVDHGYRAESVLTMIVDPPGWTQLELLRFYDAVEQDARSRPGVQSVAWASTLPMGRSYQGQSFFDVVGDPAVAESQRRTADYQIVSPTYFETLQLPVVAGRGFDRRDTPESAPVCMVNEAFVRRYLEGRSPVGTRVAIRSTLAAEDRPVVREIVGVARQVKGRPDEIEDFLQIYVPLAQDTAGDMFVLVRPASGSAAALVPSVRAAFAALDKGQVVSVRTVMTLEDVAAEATARYRFRAVLVVTFAALALLQAMVGVFGVLAYSVEQRVREFGVRRALGATTGDVLRLVVGGAARVITIGAVVGLTLSVALSRFLATMLFGVHPLDAVTFGTVGIVLVLTAALSIAGPAWRGTRVDPLVAMRTQ